MNFEGKPNDAFTASKTGAGFQLDETLWKDIDEFFVFAQGRGVQPCEDPDTTEFTKGAMIAHILYMQWNQTALGCKWAREKLIAHFGGISPMIKKPCVGFPCVVCKKYSNCKTGEYDGLLDPFKQVVHSERLSQMSINQAEEEHLFLDQQAERGDTC
jgi:hypothetical protein